MRETGASKYRGKLVCVKGVEGEKKRRKFLKKRRRKGEEERRGRKQNLK